MILVIVLLSLVSLSWQSFAQQEILQTIDIVNTDPQSTWKAGINFDEDVSLDYIRSLCGTLKTPKSKRLPVKVMNDTLIVPDSYDVREEWGTKCPSVNEIRDQGGCGSCWAFGAAEVMTDRICIHSQGKNKVRLSAEDLLACCEECGFGCEGGYPPSAFEFWAETGVVSGGAYGSSKGCMPYTVKNCSHHNSDPVLPRCVSTVVTPDCHIRCRKGYPITYQKDKHFGKKVYTVTGTEYDIKTEIVTNGPVEGSFTVYSDFLFYKSGVYQHLRGSALGGHAIKILGWGEEAKVPYWIAANSWNSAWGDKGFFKILRGSNECGIEEEIVAGIPLLV